MKKIFYILFFITSIARGQFAMPPPQNIYFQQWQELCPASQDGEHAAAINQFIIALVAHDKWSHIDRLWWFSTSDRGSAKICLNVPTATAITEVNSPTWGSSDGFTGNGSNSYLNTNYALTSGVNFTQNDGGLGVYLFPAASACSCGAIGSRNGNTAISYVYGNFTGSAQYYYCNSGTPPDLNFASSTTHGVRSSVRINSTTIGGCLNGVQTTGTSLLPSVPSANVYICGQNNAGTLQNPSTEKIKGAWIGASSVEGGTTTFYNDWKNALTVIGAQ